MGLLWSWKLRHLFSELLAAAPEPRPAPVVEAAVRRSPARPDQRVRALTTSGRSAA